MDSWKIKIKKKEINKDRNNLAKLYANSFLKIVVTNNLEKKNHKP